MRNERKATTKKFLVVCKEDAAYISEFDRQTEKYLKGECE